MTRILLAMAAFLFSMNVALACDPHVQSCPAQVGSAIAGQDAAAAGGPQWGPVNAANCAAASREMDQSAARCRSYDAAGGKHIEQCAACCRQLREGVNRQNACAAVGLAPPVNWSAVSTAKARLDCNW